MPELDIVVRKMTLDDIDHVVSLHMNAFEGTVGASLGKAYNYALVDWFITYPTSICLVAVNGITILGYVFGAPNNYRTCMNKDLAVVILRSVVTHPTVMFRRQFILQVPKRFKHLLSTFVNLGNRTTFEEPPDQEVQYRLTAVGVDPSLQSMGIGKRLISAYEGAARCTNAQTVALSVYATNTHAIRLYTQCGWQITNPQNDIITFEKRL